MDAPPAALEMLARTRQYIEERTVQIYFRAPEGNPRAIGSGTLLELNGERMLVTAAHVLEWIKNGEGMPLVANTAGQLVEIGGRVGQYVSGRNEDVAVLRLDPASGRVLAGKRTVTLVETLPPPNINNWLCAVLGHPVEQTRPAGPRAFETETYVTLTSIVTDVASALAEFDGERHLLLTHNDLVNVEGDDVRPPRLEGMSGCGVWAVFDHDRPADAWNVSSIRLVGVQTGTYDGPPALIKCTRWACVTDLIFDQWPELRPRINRISFASGKLRVDFAFGKPPAK